MGKVTVEQLKAAKMRAIMFGDGQNSYTRVYACDEFPEVTKTQQGPRGRGKGKHTETVYVNEVEVSPDWEAIAEAINASREKQSEQGCDVPVGDHRQAASDRDDTDER